MEKHNINKHLLSINEAADIFGIGRHRLRELVRNDPTVPSVKVGSFTKIHFDLFAEWLEKAVLEGRDL